jgi:hypothetical protein
MLEKDRTARNQQMLTEMYPAFRTRVQAVLKELEGYGLRPRIQEAWRSPQAQMDAFRSGHSQVMYGFHNVTAADGTKEALAADIIDDNNPTSLNLPFILHLLAAAENNDLTTGVYWNLSAEKVAAIHAAIATKNWNAKVHIGWDPLHVEVEGITTQDAKAGKRPYQETPNPDDDTGGDTPMPDDHTDQTGEKTMRYRVENLDTNEVKEYNWSTAFRPVVLLPVPYVSQLGAGATAHSNDCGATSAVMLLQAYLNLQMAPDEFYTKFAIQGDPFLSVPQLRDAMSSLGLLTDFHANLALQDLFAFLATSRPVIVLLRYKVLEEAGLTEKKFEGPHFAVVVGIDSKNIYLHDPLYTNPADGEAHAYPLDVFWQAWVEVGSDPSFPNPARSAIIPTGGIGFKVTRRVRVKIASLNVRSGPGTNNAIVASLKMGQVVEIIREVNGWGQVSTALQPQAGSTQWISLAYVAPADVPAG